MTGETNVLLSVVLTAFGFGGQHHSADNKIDNYHYYLVTPTDTTLDSTYCYRFYDLHAYSHAPTCLDDYEHVPCQQVLDDA